MKTPDRLPLGRAASMSRTVTEDDVVLFAGLTGDVNPVHLDEAIARKTRFEGRIAHGMLSAGLVSAVLGSKLPGPGTIYLGQTLKFRAPVRIGDTVTATCTITSAREDKPVYTLSTVVVNQDGATVLDGEATVLHEPIP
jgi:3-hydroxybutyryl-CoA dehydratase